MNNVFASMSSVSVFAFVDKEGIISETGKYVDEVAFIDKLGNKMVLDLMHDSHVRTEEEIYALENEKDALYKENIPLLRALSLAFMCARNPKESDGEGVIREIFSKDSKISEQIKSEIGFHFHNALRSETEAH